ncbi:MAG TPA: hypothetical protein VEX57_20365 [Microlunatus sp.]|jgi:hypothetical protein|nr:hypothetical protein [Microlunatus sp.]
MVDMLDNGHVVTDEDVDTARLIIELDRALGRPTDSLTRRVAETPAGRVRRLVADSPADPSADTNGHRIPAVEVLARTLTSPENTAELAREVGEQLPADMDPEEQARVVSKVEDVIRRRMIALVTGTDSAH